MTTDEAIAALNGLQWRSDDHMEGFAEPAGGSLPLVGESGPQPARIGTQTSLVYSNLPPPRAVTEGQALWLTTTRGTGETTTSYLQTWFEGGRREDGSVEALGPSGGVTRSWSDGQTLSVTAFGAPADQALMTALIDSIHPATPGDLQMMEANVSDRLGHLPHEASVTVGPGTL